MTTSAIATEFRACKSLSQDDLVRVGALQALDEKLYDRANDFGSADDMTSLGICLRVLATTTENAPTLLPVLWSLRALLRKQEVS